MDHQKEKGSSYYNPHVLLLPYPTQGHLNPILQFAKRLVSKGIKATLVTTIFVHNSLHLATTPTSNLNIDFETISDGYDTTGRSISQIEAYLQTFRVVGSRTLADLITRLRDSGRPVHALVYDSFLPWALDVAKDFGLAGAAFFTQSFAVNTIYYHVHKGLLRLPLSEKTVSLPTLPPLDISDIPSFVNSPESYPAHYHMVVNQFSNIDKADLVIFNGFQELENKTVEWMEKLWPPIRAVGPTVPSMYLDKRLENDKDYSIYLWKPNTDACISWLNDKSLRSVVYVSFGSLSALEAEQMRELAWGLKRSNNCFLWVVRESEETKLPLELFKDETFEKGLIVNWCPQLAVLAHKSVGCFVTHCGFNSTLEALSLGVPLVAMPQWTDQMTNAKYVEDVWGVGIRARPDEKGIVRREVVENCIKELMEGEKGKEIKKNVIKWRDLAREAVSQGGSSDRNIDEFIAKLAS
ncbi:UDP-glucuronosyl/UDP-glucosyltransferase [Trema orientale]|uniref:Glycosyltransferase n=1 Tax=Trema orientale TaxID=63057 RepID=A0A2P5CXZ9_TREOI|nr:UDP-glucuronosyl/UDP-glucosyltransferase [Trema orientale]